MRVKRLDITPIERDIINKLNHPLYTTEFIEEWVNSYDADIIDLNSLGTLQFMAARGYLEAIKLIAERINSDAE